MSQGLVRRLREWIWNRGEGYLLTSGGYRCNFLLIVCVLGLSGYFLRANRQADKGERVIEGSESFRYTI